MVKTQKRATGDLGESIAEKFLINKGFSIIERNYSKKWGEVDIIAEKTGSVRFVEVKARTVHGSREMSDYRPEELAHDSKLKKVARTASFYMEEKGDDREYQVDVIGVVLDTEKRLARCRFYEQVL